MELVQAKHANFIQFARDTLAEMKAPVDPIVQEFLARSHIEMLRMLKILLTAMPRDGVESIVLNKLGVRRADIPPERLAKLLRYSEYFCEVAKGL
jgi:hypothetical protein